MKKELQKLLILSSVLVISVGTALASTLAVYASSESIAFTQDSVGDFEEGVVIPSKPAIAEEKVEEPTFYFKQAAMTGVVNETVNILFSSSQEIEAVTVVIPQELTVIQDDLPVGLSLAAAEQEGEWLIQSERARSSFMIPVVAQASGSYVVSIAGETDATLTIAEAEPDLEESPKEVIESEEGITESQENIVTNEESERVSQEADFVGTTAEVSTAAQLSNALSNPAVGIISLKSNITTSNSVASIDRSVLVQGNGRTLTFGSSGYWNLISVDSPAVLRFEDIVLKRDNGNVAISSSEQNSSNWTLELEEVSSSNNAGPRVLANLPKGKVVFTGGKNTFSNPDATTTFITAKEIHATNQAEVSIALGNSTVFFAAASIEAPKLQIQEGAAMSITTTIGSTNTIDFRGAKAEVIVQSNSKLTIDSTGATTGYPSDGGHNVLVLPGDSSKILIQGESSFSSSGTNLKKALRLSGSNAEVIVEDSNFKLSSGSKAALEMQGDNSIFKLKNSDCSITTITGNGIRFDDGASPQIVANQSKLEVITTNAYNTSSAVALLGADASFVLENESEFQVSKKYADGAPFNVQIGDDKNPSFKVTGGSKVSIKVPSTSGAAVASLIYLNGASGRLEVSNDSEMNLQTTSGNNRGIMFSGGNGNLSVSQGSKIDVQTGAANGIDLSGTGHKIKISDHSEVNIKNNWTTEADRNAGLYIGKQGTSNGEILVTGNSTLDIASNLSSAFVAEGTHNNFNVSEESFLKMRCGATTGADGSNGTARATFRFLNSGQSSFTIDDSELLIEKDGGNASGFRMLGDDNHIYVLNKGKLDVDVTGNGTPNDGNKNAGNQGIHLTSGNNTSFEVTDPGSEVRINAHNGPAIDLGGTGKVVASNGGYFEASGKTATASGGIFRANELEVEFDNPLFMNFRNNRSGGGNIFNVGNDSVLKAINSDLTVWKKGSNLDGDPDLNFTYLADYSFTGTNFNTLASANPSDILTTETFGSAGFTTYSRMSSNNARWAIADELRIPTNADKKLYGRVSVPVGLYDSRPAWDDEATVTVEVEKKNGDKKQYTAKTKGHTNEEEGISIYGEAPRGGLFEIELADYLEAGAKVRIVEAELTSGELSAGHTNLILTDTVEVFPITPPKPVQFSSSTVSKYSKSIQGSSENTDVEITATFNGTAIDTSSVAVDANGKFRVSLAGLTLEEDDVIQVFSRDRFGDALEAGITDRPTTNNGTGNIQPATPLSYHDATFEEATKLTVIEGPISPVDPLDPDESVDPVNPPALPDDQGAVSINFISQFDFGEVPISASGKNYNALPQRLLNTDGTVGEQERPNYVQVSDLRSTNDRGGWELSATLAESGFRNGDNEELRGAQIHLKNQELVTPSSNLASQSPALKNNVAVLTPGSKQTLVEAGKTQGEGTWVNRFGNAQNAESSVQLEIPSGANPKAAAYQATIEWELTIVPGN